MDFWFPRKELCEVCLAAELPKVSWRTLQKEIQARGYHKCRACLKFYMPPDYMDIRYHWAKDKYLIWALGDWKRVPFLDEAHFGRGPRRQLLIIRQSDERRAHDCIQEQKRIGR